MIIKTTKFYLNSDDQFFVAGGDIQPLGVVPDPNYSDSVDLDFAYLDNKHGGTQYKYTFEIVKNCTQPTSARGMGHFVGIFAVDIGYGVYEKYFVWLRRGSHVQPD